MEGGQDNQANLFGRPDALRQREPQPFRLQRQRRILQRQRHILQRRGHILCVDVGVGVTVAVGVELRDGDGVCVTVGVAVHCSAANQKSDTMGKGLLQTYGREQGNCVATKGGGD